MKLLSILAFLLLTLSSAAQTWDLLTPITTGATVRNCSFLDEMHGYMVLQAQGEVFETTDGGVTWNRPWTSSSSTNLYDVEMLSMDVTITCGSNGIIFRTIDAGTSWVSVDTPTSEYLYALEFVSEMVGFASGFNGVILKTSDGGDTWQLKDSGTTDRLYDIEFASELVGYSCGWNGTVVKTEDGGETWTPLETGHESALFNCTFPTEDVGYAVGWYQSILKTADGGATWDLQFSNGNNSLNFIEFRDELNGWAAGDWGGYYSTSNGGATWTSSTVLGGYEIWGGQYLNDNCALLIGQGILFKSTDNGATWDVLKNAVPNAKYNGVHFLDDLTGYACGSVGITGEGSNQAGIVFTENGGQTWDVQNQAFSGGWWDIHFSDAQHGAVIGGANLMKTSNGGDTWSGGGAFPESLTGVGIWRINETEILAGGSGLFNNICKSSNGGITWTCGENLGAEDFYFLNEEEGWAVTEGSTQNIFHTVDGGDSWEAVDTGFSNAKTSLFFLNQNLGWLGGANGSVLRTSDAGLTWESVFAAAYDIVGIRFYDENTGFFCDNQSNVWKSEDGGTTWNVILYGDDLTMPVAEEASFTENYVYLGCWSGDIYRAELGCGSIDPPQITTQTFWCEGEGNFIGYETTAVVESFQWTVPEGWTQEGEFGSIYAVAGATGGEIGLTITNACGLTAEAAYAVDVLPSPGGIASLDYPSIICLDQAFTVEIPGAQSGVVYEWSSSAGWPFLDNGSSAEFTPNGSEGSISVFGTNECGFSEPFLVEFSVSDPPDVTLVIDDTSLCLGDVLNPQVFPLGGTLSGEGVNGLQIYSEDLTPGVNYTYTYTYEDESGCAGSAEATISFFPVPEVTMDFEGQALCIQSVVTPELTPPGGQLVGNGAQVDVIQTTFLIAGFPYDYTYTFTSEDGCTATAQETISFNDLPEVSISFDDLGLCIYADVPVNLSPEGGELSGPGANGDVIATWFLPPDEVFEYTYTYIDENGCSNSDAASTSFNMLPTVDLSFDEEGFCVENAYEAIVIPEGGELTGPGVGGLLVQSFFLNAGEPYQYIYSYTDENGCTGTDAHTLIFNPLPLVTLDFDYEEFCLEQVYTADGLPAGGTLSGEGVNGMDVESTGLVPDEWYTYTYTYTDGNACTSFDQFNIMFEICQGVDEAGQVAFLLFPNPSSGRLTLQTQDLVGQMANVYDYQGKLMISQRVETAVSSMDWSRLSAGVYEVVIGEARTKLVIK